MKLPVPDQSAKQHSEQLCDVIRQEITQSGGSIPFARFMELALYAPGLGYYMAGQQRFGKTGDFMTAPLISPLFAESITEPCKQVLSAIPGGQLLEIGAGSGHFAKDLLRELQRQDCLPAQYFILELSADLREQQRALLAAHCPDLLNRVVWLDTLPREFKGLIFANEVLDALPVNLFRVDQGEIKERCVAIDGDRFIWQNHKAPREMNELQQEMNFSNAYESEINLLLPAWMAALADCLAEGVILLFDYGYGANEYYHPDRSMGTLKCYYQHHHHDDPLVLVGLQDITAHVNFTAVAQSAVDAGLSLAGYTTQAAFLLACGLLQKAAADELTELARVQQNLAIKKLTLPSLMGEAIKVMALSKAFNQALMGFSLQDRRRDL